jgi:protein-disulfide isomerase
MTTHPHREEIMAWIDDELPSNRLTEIRAHVDGCRECRSLVEDLRTAGAYLKTWPVSPAPASLLDRLREATSEPRAEVAAGVITVHRSRRRLWRWGALAALVVAGILVPLRMQCAEASAICRFDSVRQLLAPTPALNVMPPTPGRATPTPFFKEPLSGAASQVDEPSVVVTMFIDWQCPACRAADEGYTPIFEEFARSAPGAVTLVVKDFPLNPACNTGVSTEIHKAACEAAVAVRLARARGKGREMVAWLFSHQSQLSPDGVKVALASTAGVTDFDARYADEIQKVRADADEGAALHVRFTPSCYVNGVLTNRPDGGWLPPEELRAIIQRELNRHNAPQ